MKYKKIFMASTLLGFIYGLQHPIEGEIFYVGCTRTSLTNRLRVHYQHLREYKRGLREPNKRYLYIENLGDLKAEIILLELVINDDLEKKEKEWIKKFFDINPNLTNETYGGKGGDTYSLNSDDKKLNKIYKISKKLKGKPKPKEFSENLSKLRTGLGNPQAKKMTNKIKCIDDNIVFEYGFEINQFLNNKYAYSNIYRALKSKKNPLKMYNKSWQLLRK